MKREEIEQLLAEYVNGEISPANRQLLEKLFGEDLELKKEADEMLAAWQSLNALEESIQPLDTMDDQFYAMLQRAKTDQRMADRVVSINKAWLQTAAAIIICITAFGIGRFTASPASVFKYKTVYVKQPVTAPIQKQAAIAAPIPAKPVTVAIRRAKPAVNTAIDEDNSQLAQQLRSVYTSERIGAVMKITGKGQLTDADLQQLGIALRADPTSNVR